MTLARRTPLRRTGGPRRAAGLAPTPPPARQTPLRQVSAKRAAARPTRRRVVEAVHRRDGGDCRARLAVPGVICGGEADVHEIIPRSAWAAGYLEPDNCLLVCRRHHEWIDANPDLAARRGLHGYSHQRPKETPTP